MSYLFATSVWAFPCYVTLVKDSCWTNYNVSVNVLNSETQQQVTSIQIPEGKSWARSSFNCQPGQIFSFQASFNPVFWQSDKGKTYLAKQYWLLPNAINKNILWEMPLCFPSAFAGVPFPPQAAGHCRCDFSSIPPVKL